MKTFCVDKKNHLALAEAERGNSVAQDCNEGRGGGGVETAGHSLSLHLHHHPLSLHLSSSGH